jgi:TfoX/Sxy family transcriptional regulator of competence genes
MEREGAQGVFGVGRCAMGYDEATAERVRRVLAGQEDVAERRMVGGLSFLVGGSMCCGVTSGGLMVRVGAEGREGALALPHVRPMALGGRELAGFVLVEPAGYASEEALAAWVRRGVELAEGLPEKQTRARKPPQKAQDSLRDGLGGDGVSRNGSRRFMPR